MLRRRLMGRDKREGDIPASLIIGALRIDVPQITWQLPGLRERRNNVADFLSSRKRRTRSL